MADLKALQTAWLQALATRRSAAILEVLVLPLIASSASAATQDASPSSASSFTVSDAADVASDYRFRGLLQSNRAAVIQEVCVSPAAEREFDG